MISQIHVMDGFTNITATIIGYEDSLGIYHTVDVDDSVLAACEMLYPRNVKTHIFADLYEG